MKLSLTNKMGLPSDTPQDLIVEIIRKLQGMSSNNQKENEEIVKQSKLFSFLGGIIVINYYNYKFSNIYKIFGILKFQRNYIF